MMGDILLLLYPNSATIFEILEGGDSEARSFLNA